MKHHTIIFVPHSRAKYRKWRVSDRQLRIATGVSLALLVGVTAITWLHFGTTVDLAELERLRAENQELRAVHEEFEDSFRTLQQQLGEFEDRTRDLAIIAGIQDTARPIASSGQAGAGSGGDIVEPGVGIDLESMAERAARVSHGLGAVGDQLDERKRWISSRPSISPVRGIFTSYYGNRIDPILGRPAFHNGVDISATSGKPVQATADGVVVRAGVKGHLGRSVQISHGHGVTTIYGHLEGADVEPGQRVARGEVIGRVGNSGRATGYHLHYEVRVANAPKDPLQFILDR
ncbi:MAG TPA: M23 family metallopeptidase [Thermoanaerobaculia bacterium]|nr:M23 family metallopeptidase [Thermoanaerobaculia bacterium]